MAQKTCLQIVRTVAPRLGIATPNTATGSTDLQVQQLLAFVNQEGQELAARHDWQALTHSVTFPAVASESQGKITTLISSNYGAYEFRKILNSTLWNITKRTRITGPLSAPDWNLATASNTAVGPWSEYRIRQGYLRMYPAPDALDDIRFEFVTDSWATNAAEDTPKSAFSADDDIPVLDSRLIELGTMWRWKAAKGLEYAQDHLNYENAVLDAMAGDKTGGIVRMDFNANENGYPFAVVPRSDWLQ